MRMTRGELRSTSRASHFRVRPWRLSWTGCGNRGQPKETRPQPDGPRRADKGGARRGGQPQRPEVLDRGSAASRAVTE